MIGPESWETPCRRVRTPEYHTPQDTPDLVDEQRLEDALDVAERIVSAMLAGR